MYVSYALVLLSEIYQVSTIHGGRNDGSHLLGVDYVYRYCGMALVEPRKDDVTYSPRLFIMLNVILMKKVLNLFAHLLLTALTVGVAAGSILNGKPTGLIVSVVYLCIWCWCLLTQSRLSKLNEWSDIQRMCNECCEFWESTNMYFVSLLAGLFWAIVISPAIHEPDFSITYELQSNATTGTFCLAVPIVVIIVSFLLKLKKG